MAKFVATPLTSSYGSVAAINANLTAIETAFQNTVSRDGSTPNGWTAPQDANNQKLVNLASGTHAADAATFGQLHALLQGANTGLISQLQEVMTATAGQTIFVLPSLTYTVDSNMLSVYVNGSRQNKATNYTETSSTSVTFTSGLNDGDVVTFVVNDSTTNVVDATLRATLSSVTPVASLPAPTSGERRFVNDASATTFASIVVGGGANFVPVYCDGTNWRIG